MKRTITFLVFILSTTLIYGQGIVISDEIVFADFEGDPEDFGYSVVSVWGHSEHGITDNPEKSDLNNTDKACCLIFLYKILIGYNICSIS